MKDSCSEIVKKACSGDDKARELLIGSSKNFIIKTASVCCKRYIDSRNDDEYSIAMIAFNEAIETFDHKKSTAFYSYAGMIIRRRLVDYYRSEKKHQLLSNLETQREDEVSSEHLFSFKDYLREQESIERKSEILIFSKELKEFGLSFSVLERSSPKHKDSRDKLLKIARITAIDPMLYAYLAEKKKLPQKELAKRANCSLRFLERGRAYIISMVIVFKHPELVYLRYYLGDFYSEGRDNHDE